MLQLILIFSVPSFILLLFFQSCFDPFIFRFDFVLSNLFPLEKLKAFMYREAPLYSSPDTSWHYYGWRSPLHKIFLSPWNKSTASWSKSETLGHRRWQLLKCSLFITSNPAFPPKMFALEPLYYPYPTNQLHITGLKLEIKHLFHLLTLLNFPFWNTAWDLLQLF